MSRSTWACELKCGHSQRVPKRRRHAPRERVSWNAWYVMQIRELQVTLHVSVWVEIKYILFDEFMTRSRSTWACELKFNLFKVKSKSSRHAPRERVSWNIFTAPAGILALGHAPRERVSWNVLSHSSSNSLLVTLHVSVWVEILYSVYDRWP